MALRWNFYPTLTLKERQAFAKRISQAFKDGDTAFLTRVFGGAGASGSVIGTSLDSADYAWIAGISRFQRVLLSGIRVHPQAKHMFYVMIWDHRLEYRDLSRILELEGLDGFIGYWMKMLGPRVQNPITIPSEHFEVFMQPCANEFATFCALVYRLGHKSFKEIGFPPSSVSTPPDDLVKTVMKRIEEKGKSQSDTYVPGKEYRPTSLSFELQRFIVTWRRALLGAYGLQPGPNSRVYLQGAEQERLPLFPWEWKPVRNVSGAASLQPFDLMRGMLYA